MKITIYACDVCGVEVDKSKSFWNQTILINGIVSEEYCSPRNVDLCDTHIELFTTISKKWKQDRYDRYDLDNGELQTLIRELKSLEED